MPTEGNLDYEDHEITNPVAECQKVSPSHFSIRVTMTARRSSTSLLFAEDQPYCSDIIGSWGLIFFRYFCPPSSAAVCVCETSLICDIFLFA